MKLSFPILQILVRTFDYIFKKMLRFISTFFIVRVKHRRINHHLIPIGLFLSTINKKKCP